MELGKMPIDQDKNVGYSFSHLTLKRPLENGADAVIKWTVKNGYPRATVVFEEKYNKASYQNRDNYVSYPLDNIRLIAALEEFITILVRGEQRCVELMVNYPINNNGTVVQNFIGKLIFGYSEQNGVYLLATKDTTKGVKFEFKSNTPFVKFGNGESEVNMDRQVGIAYAKALIRTLEFLYVTYCQPYTTDRQTSTTQQPQQVVNTQVAPQTSQPVQTTPVTQPVTNIPVQQPTQPVTGTSSIEVGPIDMMNMI